MDDQKEKINRRKNKLIVSKEQNKRMNCSICEKNLNDYLEGKLSSDLSKEVKYHFENCETCQELYRALRLVEQIIQEEKGIMPSPYLTNKVMDLIHPKNKIIGRASKFQRNLQPLLIAASITLALLGGIKAGNIYSSVKIVKQVPIELVLMDDLSMESVNMITQE
jgi:predicted anti-sigma-YlaC factor YlaD